MGIVVGNSTHSQSSLGTTEGRRSTGKALIKVGVDLIENGQLGEALEVFQRAQTALSIDAGATKKDDHANDGTSMTTCNTTDCKQHGTTNNVSSFATSDQDNNAVSSSSNHVPKSPPPPSSSCCKRLRQARSLARRDSVSAEKKRKTELANGTNAKIHGGNGSSPSRRTNCAAAKKGRGTKSAEEMAHVEMYREEISEDSVSVYHVMKNVSLRWLYICIDYTERPYILDAKQSFSHCIHVIIYLPWYLLFTGNSKLFRATSY